MASCWLESWPVPGKPGRRISTNKEGRGHQDVEEFDMKKSGGIYEMHVRDPGIPHGDPIDTHLESASEIVKSVSGSNLLRE